MIIKKHSKITGYIICVNKAPDDIDNNWRSVFASVDGERIRMSGNMKVSIVADIAFTAVVEDINIQQTYGVDYRVGTSLMPSFSSVYEFIVYMHRIGCSTELDDVLAEIFKIYKENTLDILINYPDLLSNYGISDNELTVFYEKLIPFDPDYLIKIYSMRIKKFFAGIRQPLVLNENNVPEQVNLVLDKNLVNKLARTYRREAVSKIIENPYILADFGKELDICDDIAIYLSNQDQEVFFEKYNKKRKIAYIICALFRAYDTICNDDEDVKAGHCDSDDICLGMTRYGRNNHDYIDLSAYSVNFLNLVNRMIFLSLYQASIGQAGYISVNDLQELFDLLYSGSERADVTNFYFDDELRLCDYLWRKDEMKIADVLLSFFIDHESMMIMSEKTIRSEIGLFESETGYCLDTEQKQAVVNALTDKISVITGGPGSGKTTIIKCILHIWNRFTRAKHCKPVISAPTGKAVSRMRDAIGVRMLSRCEAGTIARFNCISQTAFELLSSDMSDGSLVVIDEASMLDIVQMSSFLSRYSNYISNLIIIGDVNQLPSIGPGALLRDLCDYNKIKTTMLQKCYRTIRDSRLISDNAACIINNYSDMFFENLKGNENVFEFRAAHDDMINEVADFYKYCLSENISLDNIGIIAPMNRIVNEINLYFQEKLNSDGLKLICNDSLRVGDRVICGKNYYLTNTNDIKSINSIAESSGGIMNGDIGYITDHDIHTGDVIFESDVGGIYKIKFNGVRKDSVISDFKPAYCITAHKSQGSEYDAVLIILPEEIMRWNTKLRDRFITSKWLYTAVTRAKRYVRIVGAKELLINGMMNVGAERRTILSQILH